MWQDGNLSRLCIEMWQVGNLSRRGVYRYQVGNLSRLCIEMWQAGNLSRHNVISAGNKHIRLLIADNCDFP